MKNGKMISAHQPAYLPWLGYFDKVRASDVFVVLDGVQFEKNSYLNRNKVLSKNGPILLTVPISTKGYVNKQIRDIEIDTKQKWQKKHKLTIQSCYSKSPYWKRYEPFIENIYASDWTSFNELTKRMFKFFLKELEVRTEIVFQSELRTIEKKNKLILEICSKLNGTKFLFGKLGEQYANRDLFEKQGIEIFFQDYQHPTYGQINTRGDFVSHLSVLDLLFNHGPDSKNFF